MSRRRWTVAVAGMLLLAACAKAAPSAGRGVALPRTRTETVSGEPSLETDPASPPPVTIRYFNQSIDLRAWTYCFGNTCADGFPPAELQDVGNPDEVIVEFPLPGWSFTASFQQSGEKCARVQEVPLEATDSGKLLLRPAGHAGTYDVTLSGRGGGDLFVTFRWTTPRDGPLPRPEARLAILADHDGQIDSYGVELEVTNLASTPKEAAATITVRGQGGEELAFEATRARERCRPEGTVYWDGPDDMGRAAVEVGDGLFTYEVELLLDGAHYVATARWPEDEIRGNEPSVALHFTPNLPAP